MCAVNPLYAADDGELETVEVTGTNPGLEAERLEISLTPGAVSLVDMHKVREGNVGSLADMLRYVPGVWSASNAGSDGIFFSSRGSNLDATNYDMNGIKLLQDGLPVTAADGNNHNRIIDPLAARYAVFARGANGQKYGASTLGGAVNFISPTARDTAPASFSLNGGDHGLRQARVTFAGAGEILDGLVTMERKHWDGYRTHNTQRRNGVYANAGAQISRDLATRFYVTSLSNDQQLAGSLTRAQMREDPEQANPSAVSGNFQVNVDTLRLANKTAWRIDDKRSLEFGVSHEEQDLYHPIVDKVMVPIGGVLTEVFSLLIDTQQRDWGSMLRYRHSAGAHDWLFGANYGRNSVTGGNYRNDGGRRNGQSTEIDNSASTLEVYAEDRWQLDQRWTAIIGVQYVSAERQVRELSLASGALRNPRADYSALNPRLGLVYRVADHSSLYGNLSRLFEAPTNFELEDEASASEETLDAMRGNVLELGARGEREFEGGHWHWDAALYQARIRDAILSIDDPDAPGASLTTNIERSLHAGAELLLGASFALAEGGHSLAPLASYSYNRFRFDSDAVYGNNRLPAAPDQTLKAELLYRHSNGFYLGPTLDVVGARYADFSNSYKVDGYHLWGLRAGMVADRWRLFAEVKNLGDKRYVVSHGVRDFAAADAAILNPGEPLSVYAGIEWQM